MPRLLYTLEDYLETGAEAQRGHIASHLLMGASILCAIAGDIMNPERGFRALFTSDR